MYTRLKQIIESFEKASHSENFWQRIIEVLGEGLFIVDPNNIVVYWNHAAEEILGYPPQDVIGKNCIKATRCQNCRGGCSLFTEGETRDEELVFVNARGMPITVRKNSRILRDENGEVIGGIETFRDISKEKAHIEEIAQQRNILETIINSMTEGAIACDNEMNIVSFSQRSQEITGYNEKDMLGKRMEEILGAEVCKESGPLKRVLTNANTQESFVNEVKTKSGNLLPVEVTATPLVDLKGKVRGGLVLIRDVRPEMHLRELVLSQNKYAQIVGRSETMRRIYEIIEQVAPTDASVFITGESGTGKELVARAMHYKSKRSAHPFVAINCAALPAELLESELFGYEKGAFTGAVQSKRGRFELAGGGTLFLDEIGELPLLMQAKLLRVLEEKVITRIGSTTSFPIDVRIVSATNREMDKMVEEGSFRRDLYYRLKVVPINIPPLRERREDIEPITIHYLEEYAKKHDQKPKILSPAVRKVFYDYDWHGNVRELFNVLEYALTMCRGDVIELEDLPYQLKPSESQQGGSYSAAEKREFPVINSERNKIISALSAAGGNRSKAAEILGVDRSTLWRKMKKLNISS
ncbi:MAG: hypothetical protein Kow0090_18910 [Myxococcota bacterium]